MELYLGFSSSLGYFTPGIKTMIDGHMIPMQRYRGKRDKLAYFGSRVKALLHTAPDTFLATGCAVSYLVIALRLVYLILSAWVSDCVCTGSVSGGLLDNLKLSVPLAPHP